ncbi:MAG: DUF3148 domain-containing protein [Cyanobacteria bacterium K_Offshore_surface_m2_239]|nr:DUF3148 domain-containing protein [Cyanobacteria bacterium K_Offshore_surface_m2_239]
MSSPPPANPLPEPAPRVDAPRVDAPIGARVRLQGAVAYLKTADPMPMLRPPDLVDPEELGLVVERRAKDQLAVRFRRGTFLLSSAQLQTVLTPGEEATEPER